jgi:hypothetical protein
MNPPNVPSAPLEHNRACARLIAIALVLIAIAIAADLTWMLPRDPPATGPRSDEKASAPQDNRTTSPNPDVSAQLKRQGKEQEP